MRVSLQSRRLQPTWGSAAEGGWVPGGMVRGVGTEALPSATWPAALQKPQAHVHAVSGRMWFFFSEHRDTYP